MQVDYLGKELGYASGWDGEPGSVFWFYNFKPAKGIEIPACEVLQINEDTATITAQDKDGNSIKTFNIIWHLSIAGEAV